MKVNIKKKAEKVVGKIQEKKSLSIALIVVASVLFLGLVGYVLAEKGIVKFGENSQDNSAFQEIEGSTKKDDQVVEIKTFQGSVEDLINAINQKREESGLAKLKREAELDESSSNHVQDAVGGGYFSEEDKMDATASEFIKKTS